MNEQMFLQVVGKLSMEKELLLSELTQARNVIKEMQDKLKALSTPTEGEAGK